MAYMMNAAFHRFAWRLSLWQCSAPARSAAASRADGRLGAMLHQPGHIRPGRDLVASLGGRPAIRARARSGPALPRRPSGARRRRLQLGAVLVRLPAGGDQPPIHADATMGWSSLAWIVVGPHGAYPEALQRLRLCRVASIHIRALLAMRFDGCSCR